MNSDAAILTRIDHAFGGAPRPEHFTDYTHCSECAEHDALLLSRDRSTLRVEDVINPGWDPLCFCSAEGLAYFFPALARFTLQGSPADWYGVQLVFHLFYGNKDNRFYLYCTPMQRQAVSALVTHLINTRTAIIDACMVSDDFLRCHELWT